MKSSKPSPSTSEAAGEVKILLSFCLPSSLISHRDSLDPPPSPPSFPSKAWQYGVVHVKTSKLSSPSSV